MKIPACFMVKLKQFNKVNHTSMRLMDFPLVVHDQRVDKGYLQYFLASCLMLTAV